MTEEQKIEIEKLAEEKCRLHDRIHRDCYIAGFVQCARYYYKRLAEYKERYQKQKLINMEMLEEMQKMIEALDRAGIKELGGSI